MSNPRTTTTISLSARVAHLSTKLHPLISLSTGTPHPSFPATLLHYHLLSAAQLDDLASYYHQRSPSAYSMQYPLPVIFRWKQPPSLLVREKTLLQHSLARSVAPEEAEEFERRIINLARDNNSNSLVIGETDPDVLVTEYRRRRFGRFIGLRGCESPSTLEEEEGQGMMQEQMEAWIKEELARKRGREEDAERVREKNWGRRGGMF